MCSICRGSIPEPAWLTKTVDARDHPPPSKDKGSSSRIPPHLWFPWAQRRLHTSIHGLRLRLRLRVEKQHFWLMKKTGSNFLSLIKAAEGCVQPLLDSDKGNRTHFQMVCAWGPQYQINTWFVGTGFIHMGSLVHELKHLFVCLCNLTKLRITFSHV